ncbi:MAG: hypothetical protein ACERKT_05775, partial [Acidobacteriota bacterium]
SPPQAPGRTGQQHSASLDLHDLNLAAAAASARPALPRKRAGPEAAGIDRRLKNPCYRKESHHVLAKYEQMV